MAADRSFHQDTTSVYCLPNDSTEHSRLDVQAKHISTVMNGRIIHSPLQKEEARRLLDVGCGTGYVTMTMARLFPQAEVFGLDLSPVPARQSRPANARFLRGNVLTQQPVEWVPAAGEVGISRNEDVLDLIYSRLLIGGMNDWPKFIRREYHLLRPGGWAEIHELDPMIYDGQGQAISSNSRWFVEAKKACEERSMDWSSARLAAARMNDAGFVDVEVCEYSWPIGGVGERTPELQEAGKFFCESEKQVYEIVIRQNIDMAESEKEDLIGEMQADLEPAPGKHMKMVVTWGRKPTK